MKIELVDSLPVLKEPVLSPNTVLVPSQDQFPPLPSKLTQQGFPSKNSSDSGLKITACQVLARQEEHLR